MTQQSDLRPIPSKGAHVHKMVAKVAEGIAQEIYEKNALRSNEFYAQYPDRDEYVRKCWPLYIEAARATLAELLKGNMEEKLKEEIYDALIRDATLRRGREGALQMKEGKGAI